MTPFFIMLNKLGWFRVTIDEEMVGLDVSKHGGSAYELAQGAPANKKDYDDFIKSQGV